MDWTKFSDSDLELELCDRYGAAADFSARGLMILALETTTRAVAAETARDSCYRAAAEVSGWLNTANKAVEVVSARAAELEASRTVALVRLAEKEQRERAILAESSTGIPWVHDDTFSYIVQELEAARARIAQLSARAAELQTALDAERAAHRWRPVTEPPEEGQEVAIVIGARYWGEIEESDNKAGAPVGWYYTDDGDYFGPEFPKGWLPLCQEPQ